MTLLAFYFFVTFFLLFTTRVMVPTLWEERPFGRLQKMLVYVIHYAIFRGSCFLPCEYGYVYLYYITMMSLPPWNRWTLMLLKEKFARFILGTFFVGFDKRFHCFMFVFQLFVFSYFRKYFSNYCLEQDTLSIKLKIIWLSEA